LLASLNARQSPAKKPGNRAATEASIIPSSAAEQRDRQDMQLKLTEPRAVMQDFHAAHGGFALAQLEASS